MGEVPALNIVTDGVTPMPLAEFYGIVNPSQLADSVGSSSRFFKGWT